MLAITNEQSKVKERSTETKIMAKIKSVLFQDKETQNKLIVDTKTGNFDEALNSLLFKAKGKDLQCILAPKLRAAMINYLDYSKNPKASLSKSFYDAFKVLEREGFFTLSYEKYIELGALDGTWGSDIEALALAELFEVSLVVYLIGGIEGLPNLIRKDTPEKGVIILYCQSETHWHTIKDQPGETIGDGNCLYNAFAQMLRQLALSQTHADNQLNRTTPRSEENKQEDNKNNIVNNEQQAPAPNTCYQAYKNQQDALHILAKKDPFSGKNLKDSAKHAVVSLKNNPHYLRTLQDISNEDSTRFPWGKAILAVALITLGLAAIASGVGAFVGIALLATGVSKLVAGLLVVGGITALLGTSIYLNFEALQEPKIQSDETTKTTSKKISLEARNNEIEPTQLQHQASAGEHKVSAAKVNNSASVTNACALFSLPAAQKANASIQQDATDNQEAANTASHISEPNSS